MSRIRKLAGFAGLMCLMVTNHALASDFSTGAKCAVPGDFTAKEKTILNGMVKKAASVERHWNVAVLGMKPKAYDKGERFVRVEFDCANLSQLSEYDGDRRKQVQSLLSTDARSAVMTGARRYKDSFKANVDIVRITAASDIPEREARVELKDKVLSISRSNFRSGGWTDADWKDWLGENLSATDADTGTVAKFTTGRACERPEGFNQAEWQALRQEVKVAADSEERWNVTYLGQSKRDFDAGKRVVQIEFDCASLSHLEPADSDRVSQIRALLSRDARGAVQTAGRRFKAKFGQRVNVVVLAAHAGGKTKDTKISLGKKGALRISRVNFLSGGYTDYDWRNWFEKNL